MKRLLFLLLPLVPGLVGCQRAMDGPLTMRLTGLVLRDPSTSPPQLHFADLEEIATERGDAVADLTADNLYTSRYILKIEIEQTRDATDYDYKALIIPRDGESASWKLIDAEKGVQLTTAGTVYMWGIKPRAWTPMVTAGSEGSTLVLHDDGMAQRVYFVNGTSAFVVCTPATGLPIRREFPLEQRFYKFPDDCNLTSTPALLATDPDYPAFEEIARVAGWTPGS